MTFVVRQKGEQMNKLIDADALWMDIIHAMDYCDDILEIIERQPSAEPQWIPCSERLPEEGVKVLISYRYKEGEGDTSHIDIDITTYGQMYFGGNKVGNHKHWRAPFEYFESNYEVVAWMPLPEPFTEEEK